MERYYLTPNNGQKSFYGKAEVIRNYGREFLFSYGTLICAKIGGKIHRLCGENECTATTLKHIKAFCGLNKKDFLRLDFCNCSLIDIHFCQWKSNSVYGNPKYKVHFTDITEHNYFRAETCNNGSVGYFLNNGYDGYFLAKYHHTQKGNTIIDYIL